MSAAWTLANVETDIQPERVAMVASIRKIASPSQGASYYERDEYYASPTSATRTGFQLISLDFGG